MTEEMLTLDDGMVSVTIDPGRGADVLSMVHLATGIDVMFRSPWRGRADEIRSGRSTPTTSDPVAGWLEQYRGGWQTLLPNAGAPRLVAGAPVGFHGEAASSRWEVLEIGATAAWLSASLFAVPVSIDRHIALDGSGTLSISDVVTNLSDVPIEIDYVSHPALGGAFLDGPCVIETGARTYTADPDTSGSCAGAGTAHTWPFVGGEQVDFRVVPNPGARRAAFGWLSDFDEPWAMVTNTDLGLTVRLDWDDTYLPYAWFWQELNETESFPWYRRARVLAIEPSSTITGGPDRASALVFDPHESVQIRHSLGLCAPGRYTA